MSLGYKANAVQEFLASYPIPGLAIESCVDMLADKLGLDRAEFRLRNLIRPEQMPWYVGTESVKRPTLFDSGDYPALLTDSLARFGVVGGERVHSAAGADDNEGLLRCAYDIHHQRRAGAGNRRACTAEGGGHPAAIEIAALDCPCQGGEVGALIGEIGGLALNGVRGFLQQPIDHHDRLAGLVFQQLQLAMIFIHCARDGEGAPCRCRRAVRRPGWCKADPGRDGPLHVWIHDRDDALDPADAVRPGC